jgi:hypothetical protein
VFLSILFSFYLPDFRCFPLVDAMAKATNFFKRANRLERIEVLCDAMKRS